MRRAALTVPVLLAIAGCAPPPPVIHWARPGGTDADFSVAASGCEARALGQAPPVTLGLPGYFPNPETWCTPTSGGPNCVEINPGYLPQSQAAGDTNKVARERVFEACMMSGGWRTVSSPGEGEMVTRSAAGGPVPEAAIGKALTYCEAIFRRDRNADFDRCVMIRAHEINTPG